MVNFFEPWVNRLLGLLIWSSGKNLPVNAEDQCLTPGSERSPGEGNVNPLQYSCLENPMDRGDCKAVVHGAAKRCD